MDNTVNTAILKTIIMRMRKNSAAYKETQRIIEDAGFLIRTKQRSSGYEITNQADTRSVSAFWETSGIYDQAHRKLIISLSGKSLVYRNLDEIKIDFEKYLNKPFNQNYRDTLGYTLSDSHFKYQRIQNAKIDIEYEKRMIEKLGKELKEHQELLEYYKNLLQDYRKEYGLTA